MAGRSSDRRPGGEDQQPEREQDECGAGRGGACAVQSGVGNAPHQGDNLAGLLKDLKISAVPHGFRSSFRDWAAEETDHPREVIEAALAHVVRNKVEAAYRRTDLFERRRILMHDWAAYLDRERESAG